MYCRTDGGVLRNTDFWRMDHGDVHLGLQHAWLENFCSLALWGHIAGGCIDVSDGHRTIHPTCPARIHANHPLRGLILMVALSLLLCLLALILLNVPIAFSIGITSLGYLLLNDINVALLAQRATQGIYSYPFLALPLFVFAGALMEQGGITRRLMRLANAIIGHVSGGLAGVTVRSEEHTSELQSR